MDLGLEVVGAVGDLEDARELRAGERREALELDVRVALPLRLCPRRDVVDPRDDLACAMPLCVHWRVPRGARWRRLCARPMGPVRLVGLVGLVGPMGLVRPLGVGPVGPRGLGGLDGLSGPSGPCGPSGPSGPSGPVGARAVAIGPAGDARRPDPLGVREKVEEPRLESVGALHRRDCRDCRDSRDSRDCRYWKGRGDVAFLGRHLGFGIQFSVFSLRFLVFGFHLSALRLRILPRAICRAGLEFFFFLLLFFFNSLEPSSNVLEWGEAVLEFAHVADAVDEDERVVILEEDLDGLAQARGLAEHVQEAQGEEARGARGGFARDEHLARGALLDGDRLFGEVADGGELERAGGRGEPDAVGDDVQVAAVPL